MKDLTKVEKFLHLFLPHPHTHQKAKLLDWHFLVIYILLFLLLRTTLSLITFYKPGVLGVNSNIDVATVIEKTNLERQKLGLPPLQENSQLDEAAKLKAQNMFEENYWAHFAPSGKDPWGFINQSGYKFAYAGENLARNFYTSDDVVKAWMNSPTHRENIVNQNYQDIGIAVAEGVLQGQKTTLIVQMFGKSYQPGLAVSKVDLAGKQVEVKSESVQGKEITLSVEKPTLPKASFDPFAITKTVGTILFSLVAMLVLLDFVVLKRRGVFRLSSHHLAHLSFLAISSMALLLSKAGEIL